MLRNSLLQLLPRIVARVPAKVHAKLLIAFLTITVLLIALGAVGLQALNDTNQRAKDLVELQRKIAAYRQLQHDTTAQLYSVASALLVHDERTLDATLRQLNQFGYDLDRLQFVAKDEVELLGQVRKDYDQFIQVVSQSVELIRAGKIAEGNQLQLTQANPLAERLERLMNQLVNRAEADMVASIEASETAYAHSRRIVIGFAVGSIALALILGYAISWSIVGPVQQMDSRFQEIASGDFSRQIEIPNQDELGTLADNLNRMSEELGRLYQQIETRNRELSESLEQQTATGEILRVIASSPTDIQPVLDVVSENAARLCEATNAQIFRFDGNVLKLVSNHGDFPATIKERPAVRATVVGRAFVDRLTIHVHDLAAALEFEFPESKEPQQRFGQRTVLATPLLREGLPIGVVVIRRTEVRPFTDKQIALLKTFADQAVIAIENVRLFQELEASTGELARSVEELKALGDVGQAVSSTLDLQTVLTTVVARAVELSATEGGVIYEYDEQTQEFHLTASHHMHEELNKALQATPIHLGEGAVGQAAAMRAPVQISDTLDEREYGVMRLRPVLAHLGYRSLLAIPLLREDRIVGGLVVWRREAGNFPSVVINLIQTFAAQSVLAIQNARLFREIEEKSRQLEAANRHKSDFLARVSHDLRTPLNAIMGFTRIVVRRMEGQMPDLQKDNLQKVLISSEHLLNLINGLLDLAKIDAGKMEVSADTFRVEDIINMTTATVEPLLKDGRVRIVRDVTPNLPPLKTDRDKLKQILFNLLSNAAKFTEQGEIKVSASPENGNLKLAVADTGIGMKKEALDHIFEEFQQAEKTTASKYGGTGLGLAIVKKFINLMGGEIGVESEEGKGSKFTITLPMELKQ